MILRRPEEAGLAEGAENDFHLARHVHFQHEGLRGNAGIPADLERGHDSHPEHRAHSLLHEQIQRGLGLRGHLDGPGAKDAQGFGEAEHAVLGATASVRLHTHAAPEALARHITRARRHAGHARRHEDHVDGLGRENEIEGEAVAGAEGDGAARPQGGRDVALEDGGNHLIGEEHENHVT